MRGRDFLAGLMMFVALGALGGCGYSSESMLPEGIDQVAVDIFGNETFYRELEFDLARELTQEFNHRTHYRVARRRNADAVLTGRIVQVRRPTFVESTGDRVSEQGVILACEVNLRSLRDGRVIDTFLVRNRAEFVVERGETLETAFAEVLHDLAEQIVNQLQRKSFVRDLRDLRNGSELEKQSGEEPASSRH